ncbi:MAG: alpha/beta fold hydrolase [Planctomycetaceae bacterium]|nr:alpha/beta fold hydrolase [Planctomycetaceae bacterium]
MSRWMGYFGTFVLACGLLAAGGCEGAIVAGSDHLDNGLVIILPGIDGGGLRNLAIADALKDQNVPVAVEVFDWTSPLGPLFNQVAVDANHRRAADLAEHIERYRKDHPNGQVYLIGHSGGTAIAAWAAEDLAREGTPLGGIVMLGSSLSPGYDLSTALQATRGGIVNFYSARDSVLGGAVSAVGTMDRMPTEGAGKVGFDARGDSEKLVQVAWSEEMASAGNHGDHFSCCDKGFIGAYVAPLITRWNQPVVATASPGPVAQQDVAAAK